MRKLLMIVAGLATAVTLTPAAHADVVAPPVVGVFGSDDITELAQPQIPPDPGGGNAGQYRCDLKAYGRATPNGSGDDVSYGGSIACTDVMRGIDMNSYLSVSTDGGATYTEIDGPRRATCVDCAATTPTKVDGWVGPTHGTVLYRTRVDYKIGFTDGHAWRFSPLCGEPVDNIVTCRKYQDFFSTTPA